MGCLKFGYIFHLLDNLHKKHLPTTLVSECYFVEISQGHFQKNQFETAPFLIYAVIIYFHSVVV